jgi:hypothetical protein
VFCSAQSWVVEWECRHASATSFGVCTPPSRDATTGASRQLSLTAPFFILGAHAANAVCGARLSLLGVNPIDSEPRRGSMGLAGGRRHHGGAAGAFRGVPHPSRLSRRYLRRPAPCPRGRGSRWEARWARPRRPSQASSEGEVLPSGRRPSQVVPRGRVPRGKGRRRAAKWCRLTTRASGAGA